MFIACVMGCIIPWMWFSRLMFPLHCSYTLLKVSILLIMDRFEVCDATDEPHPIRLFLITHKTHIVWVAYLYVMWWDLFAFAHYVSYSGLSVASLIRKGRWFRPIPFCRCRLMRPYLVILFFRGLIDVTTCTHNMVYINV